MLICSYLLIYDCFDCLNLFKDVFIWGSIAVRDRFGRFSNENGTIWIGLFYCFLFSKSIFKCSWIIGKSGIDCVIFGLNVHSLSLAVVLLKALALYF